MPSKRRPAFAFTFASTFVIVAFACHPSAHAEGPTHPGAEKRVAVASAPAVATPSPDDLLARLSAGNARFADNLATHSNQGTKRRVETAAGQHPFVTILGCSDSTVPPEVVFDEGIGDIFSIRALGNVVDAVEMGSIEYGVDHLGTPLLVVMGHAKCGAVTAAATHAAVPGHIATLALHITPAVDATRKKLPHAADAELVTEAVKANVFHSMATLLRESEPVRDRVTGGRARVEGAVYDVITGNVEWLGRHPDESALLAEPLGTSAHTPAHDDKGSHGDADAKGRHDDHDAKGGPSGHPAASEDAAHSASALAGPGHEMTAAELPRPGILPIAYAGLAFLCTLAGALSQRLLKKTA